MSECVHVKMDYFSDDEDFCLTQESTRSFEQTQSSSFGGDIVDNQCVVWLENNSDEKFEANVEFVRDGSSDLTGLACDNIVIEDISDDETGGKM